MPKNTHAHSPGRRALDLLNRAALPPPAAQPNLFPRPATLLCLQATLSVGLSRFR